MLNLDVKCGNAFSSDTISKLPTKARVLENF